MNKVSLKLAPSNAFGRFFNFSIALKFANNLIYFLNYVTLFKGEKMEQEVLIGIFPRVKTEIIPHERTYMIVAPNVIFIKYEITASFSRGKKLEKSTFEKEGITKEGEKFVRGVLKIPGVKKVKVSPGSCTIEKYNFASWKEIEPKIIQIAKDVCAAKKVKVSRSV